MQISPLESLKRVQLHIWLIGLTNWIKKICYMFDVRTQRINFRVKSGKTKLGREKTAWKWIITLAPHHLPKKMIWRCCSEKRRCSSCCFSSVALWMPPVQHSLLLPHCSWAADNSEIKERESRKSAVELHQIVVLLKHFSVCKCHSFLATQVYF